NAASEAREQTALATVSLGPGSVLSVLEDERNAAGVYLLGAENDFALAITDNGEARAATEEAIESFRSTLAGATSDVRAAYEPALEALNRLASIRQRVD